MTTIYQYRCDYCGSVSSDKDKIIACAHNCLKNKQDKNKQEAVLKVLDSLFDDPWCPPNPLYRFKDWSEGDRKELANRISSVFELLEYRNHG